MRYIPGHIVRHLTIAPDELVELPSGSLLTGEGWRLANGSLYIMVSVPKDAPPLEKK